MNTPIGTKVRKLFAITIISDPFWLRALLRHHVAAGEEHIGVLRHLGEIHIVVDIGANRGQFALAARRCFPYAKVFSFEPLVEPATVYRALFEDDKNVQLWNVAIGTDPGESVIHVSAHDDSSSLLPITEEQDALFPGTAEVGIESIQVARLSDCLQEEIQKPALLKLDVQGYELQALEGCEDLLLLFDWVYAECSFLELYEGQALADEVIAWLRQRRFKLRGVYHMAYDADGRAVQADFLFSRGKKIPETLNLE